MSKSNDRKKMYEELMIGLSSQTVKNTKKMQPERQYEVSQNGELKEEHQEKAQKLAEDLDLLDGLKLSVQHCEEVMAKNAERYPLLKRMYEVLKRQNTELKDEIKSLRAEIEEREAEENAEGENE